MSDYGPPDNGHPEPSTNGERPTEQHIYSVSDGFKARMAAIYVHTGERWTLRKVARLVLLQNRIVKAFALNRRPYQYICDVCKRLELHQSKCIVPQHFSDRQAQDFNHLPRPERQHDGYGSALSSVYSRVFNLGQLRHIRIRSESCPFCKLVIYSLRELPLTGGHRENSFSPTGFDQKRHESEIIGATCTASFQMDGREVFRDESGNVVRSVPITRRIHLRWSHEELQDAYIVMVAPQFGRGYKEDRKDRWESNALYLARNIGMASENDARIRRWVHLCHEHHGEVCNKEPGPDFNRLISKAFFGVIDVTEMRLAPLPRGCRYVALSYTWGSQPVYVTTSSNIRLHQEYDGLSKVWAKLPKVIRDAVSLVRSLRERYLWVDSLCIIQRNEISWSLNSSAMDLVYGNAYVTICAAEGEGSQIGFRGLDPKRHVSQIIEECAKDLPLTVSHLAETYIEKSKWNTRGWTFQERLLSRRCIIFAGDRTFFQCRSTALSEDINGELETAGWSIEHVQTPLQMLVDIESRGFSIYLECVRLYSKRDLGKRKDILAAFRGISNLLGNEMGAPLHFGLPTTHFDLALLWEPVRACKRRLPDTEKEEEEFGNLIFPSWSWCGWSGSAIEYRVETVAGCLVNVSQWLAEHTWISWYIRDGEGDLRPVWNSSSRLERNDDELNETRWSGYGCFTGGRYDDYGRAIKKEYLYEGDRRLERNEFKRTLPEYPFGISQTTRGPESRVYPDRPYLQFWTWSAYLRVLPRESAYTPPFERSLSSPTTSHASDTGLVRFDITDYCGDWCGTILLNETWLHRYPQNHQEEEAVYEFIAISEAKNFSDEESDIWTYYVPRERAQAEWHLYYVLLVTRQGEVCYRQGLGKIFKDAFGKSYLPGKEWKEIIMG